MLKMVISNKICINYSDFKTKNDSFRMRSNVTGRETTTTKKSFDMFVSSGLPTSPGEKEGKRMEEMKNL